MNPLKTFFSWTSLTHINGLALKHVLILLYLLQLCTSDPTMKQDAFSQTDITHKYKEECVYYKTEFKEELVQICSVIYETTLKDDELEEGFSIDRCTQTKKSGTFLRHMFTNIDYLSLCLGSDNIYTGDICVVENLKSVLTQTIITDILKDHIS